MNPNYSTSKERVTRVGGIPTARSKASTGGKETRDRTRSWITNHIDLIVWIALVLLAVKGFTHGKLSLLTYAAVPTATANHIRTTLTSSWSPSSPDPSGIAFVPQTGRLLVSDGEVDEMPQLFTGNNVFETTTEGHLIKTVTTLPYSYEATGVALNPTNGHVFFSDDNRRMVFEVDPGPDNILGSIDDKQTSFTASAFGSTDPEGVAFGQGAIFLADGVGAEVYRVDPGSNVLFDGVAPTGDDIISHFDTSSLGETDPEGIEYNPDTETLFLVGHGNRNQMLEISLAGTLLRVVNISVLGANKPSGLAYGANSVDPSKKSFYLVDRGVDNDTDPNENDGKLYEFTIAPSSTSPTPSIACSGSELGTLSCFELWRRAFTGELPATDGDFNGDGNASLADFEVWRRGFL